MTRRRSLCRKRGHQWNVLGSDGPIPPTVCLRCGVWLVDDAGNLSDTDPGLPPDAPPPRNHLAPPPRNHLASTRWYDVFMSFDEAWFLLRVAKWRVLAGVLLWNALAEFARRTQGTLSEWLSLASAGLMLYAVINLLVWGLAIWRSSRGPL